MCEMLPLAKELAEETERHGPVSDNQEVQQKGLTVGRGMKMRTDFLNLFKPKPEPAPVTGAPQKGILTLMMTTVIG